MSDHHYDFPKTTVKQVIFAAVGGLVPPLIVIILIVNYVLGIQASHIDDLAPAKVDTSEIEARIKPVAVVEKQRTSLLQPVRPAKVVKKSSLQFAAPVSSGAMGAPKPGDNAAWAPRIAQGYETLTKHAIEGIRQMPARGGASDLSDNEVAAAVAFMANQSGAKFAAPATPAAATAPASGVRPRLPMPENPVKKLSKPVVLPAMNPAQWVHQKLATLRHGLRALHKATIP